MKRLALFGSAAAAVALLAAGVGAAATSVNTICVGPAAPCYSTIQSAVDAAHDGDTIQIAPGTFAGGVTIDKSVSLIGAGAASTTIAGGGPVLTIGVPNAPSEPTVAIDGVTVTGGVTIGNLSPFQGRGGGIYIPRAEGPSTGATVTIRNSVIRGNTVAPREAVDSGIPCPGGGDCPFASAGGGGISNDGTLTLDHTLVADNRADAASGLTSDADGGGILNRAFGKLTLKSSVVTDNHAAVTAPNGRFADSGGILMVAGTLTVDDSVVSDNKVDFSTAFPPDIEGGMLALAGGLHIEGDASATVRSTTISGNSVVAVTPFGVQAFSGGIDDDGSLVLSDSTVSDNSVSDTAGAAPSADADAGEGGLEIDGAATISNTRFTGNSVVATAPAGRAIAEGGGIGSHQTRGVATIGGSVVGGNSVHAVSSSGSALALGGGIEDDGFLELRNNTQVSDNTATASGPAGLSQGGGVWASVIPCCGFTGPGALILRDSSIVRNTASGSPSIPPQGGGLFTTFPVAAANTVIAQNSPDQCFALSPGRCP